MRRTVLLLAFALVGAACAPPIEGGGILVRGTAVSGPSCPVVREPPDPACDDRPVAGAEIMVVDASGDVVASLRTDERGAFEVSLEAGEYRLVPQPVEGLMGTAAALDIVVADGAPGEPVTIAYDTGIR